MRSIYKLNPSYMRFVFICSSIVLLFTISCKKKTDIIKTEEVATTMVDPLACDTCSERFMDYFSTVEAKNYVIITTHSESSRFTISQEYRYKMLPEIEVDGAYFYKILKKSKYYYDNDPHETDYEETAGYYRYNYAEKKAYRYASLTDASPLLLMDFNHEVGDSITLDVSSIYGDIQFVVDEVETFLLDGYPMPKLTGHFWVNSLRHNSDFTGMNEKLVLTPYYPNPVWFDHPFDFYRYNDWSESNFAESLAFETHADQFSYYLYSEDEVTLSEGRFADF
jgi:hypothetical protein